MHSHTYRILISIIIAGAILRTAVWIPWKDSPVKIVDAQDYNRLAIGLVETGNFLDENGSLTSLRPPLYPAFVAGIYRVFGVENYAAVRAIQNLLSLVTVYLVFLLGKACYDDKTALWSAGIFCFYPSLIGFNNLLLSETLFTFCVVGCTLTAIYAVKDRTYYWLVPLALFIASGALIRSILWLFSPFLSLFLFFAWSGKLHQRLIAAGLPLALILLLLAPWIYRNTKLHKTFTVIDVMGGRNAMMGNYEHTPLERNWATVDIVRGEKTWYRVLANETEGYENLTQGEIDKRAMKHGIKFVFANPFLTAKRDVVRFFNFWQLDRTLIAGSVKGIFGDIPKPVILLLGLVICGYYAFTLFSGIYAVVLFPPEHRLIHYFLVFSILFPCAIHTLIFAHSRYHLPIIPLIALYSAAALVHCKQIWNLRSSKAVLGLGMLCAVFVLAWLREMIFVDLGNL